MSATSSPGRPRPLPWIRRFVAAVLGLVVTAILVEGGFRLALGEEAEVQAGELRRGRDQALELLRRPTREAFAGMFVGHPYYGYTLRPGLDGPSAHGWQLTTDRYGFRNEAEFDFDAIDEGTKVLGLFGGSAAFGWGIDGNEGTLARRLDELLAQRYGEGTYRVVNLALPAWHQPQQYILFSRLAERLDGAILFDGWNELFVPLSNNFDYGSKLPADFPWSPFFTSLHSSGDEQQSLEAYAVLLRESRYDPDSLLARSAVYNWLRFRDREKSRERAVVGLQTRPKEGGKQAWPGETRFPRDAEGYAQTVEYCASEYLKYSRLFDGVAASFGVEVLHALQPFQYADAELPEAGDRTTAFARVLFQEGHPAGAYARMRSVMAAHYGSLSEDSSAQFVDMSLGLPIEDAWWLDLVHPSAQGVERIAQDLVAHLTESGFLARVDDERP